jgi:hypothetical protein
MPVMSDKVPAILVRYTTPEERSMIAKWVREAFDLDIDWHADDVGEDYEDFDILLLGLESDAIDDETFLRISREMESYHYVVDRLLKLGRLDEALAPGTVSIQRKPPGCDGDGETHLHYLPCWSNH